MVADSLVWEAGERERFRATLLSDDIRYFVDAEKIAACRDTPGKLSRKQWQALSDEGGYHIHLVVAYGPSEIALAALSKQLDGSDSIWPLGGALAVLGEPVIPLVIRSLERAVGNIENGVYKNQIVTALADIAPIRSVQIAELVAAVISSKAKPKIKSTARAWEARHATALGKKTVAPSAAPARPTAKKKPAKKKP